MIEVAQEIITEYMTDSTNKEIIISPTNGVLEDVNYYTGNITGDGLVQVLGTPSSSLSGWSIIPDSTDLMNSRLDNYVEWNYLQDHDYIVCAFNLKVSGSASIVGGKWRMIWEDTDGNAHIANIKNDNWIAYYYTASRVVLEMPIPDNMAFLRGVSFAFNGTATLTNYYIYEGQLQINFTDTEDYIPDYKIAPDFTDFDADNYLKSEIDNNSLVYEEFALTESLCSKDNIKFGLCEAAHCEFSEVGENVKVGDEISVYSNLPNYSNNITDDNIFKINWVGYDGTPQISGTDAYIWWTLMPFNSTYNAKWQDYIDRLGLADKYIYYQFNLKMTIANMTQGNPTYFKYKYYALVDGADYTFTSNSYYNVADYTSDYNLLSGKDIITWSYGKNTEVYYFAIKFYDADKNEYTYGQNTGNIQIDVKEIQFRIGDAGHTMPAYSQDDLYIVNGNLEQYLSQWGTHRIPLGVFQVASVSNEYKHNIIKKKITAYDKMLPLENNAADWYTQYMFGIDFDSWNANGFKFARQIFSTYWNYITSVGLDSDDRYTDSLINSYDYVTLRDNYMTSEVVSWTSSSSARLSYAKITIASPDTTKLHKVVVNNYDSFDPTDIPDMLDNFDSLGRGATTNGDVLVEIVGDTTRGILCNSGDYFMLPDDCTTINIYLPAEWKRIYAGSWQTNGLIHDVSIYKTTEDKPDLVNGDLRLCYYNYNTKDIFACESSITGRDVVRSLLEICGCFFRISRYGLPEFVYPTKGGLYPSNTLYPADDLYPRAGTDLLSSMGKYMSVIAEDYEVKDYGRIQILKKIKSADTESICEWQYEGNPDKENTYIIDDNIFYCADDMLYDYGGMPEVSDMLEGMWNVISNLGYVPNITQALGAPWIECGDRIGLLTYDGGFETFVFRRTLKGIQNLRDTYESEGDECNEAINNFGY